VKTRYQFSAINATPFGGLYSISELLFQLKFDALFQDVFGSFRKVRKSSPVNNISMLVATILSGGEREYASFGNLKRRYYVERSLREKGSQLDMLEKVNYRIVISNDLHRQPHTLFDHYNKSPLKKYLTILLTNICNCHFNVLYCRKSQVF